MKKTVVVIAALLGAVGPVVDAQAPTTANTTAPVPPPVPACTVRADDDDPNTIYLAGITPVDDDDFGWVEDIFNYTVQLINQGAWRWGNNDTFALGLFGGDNGLKLIYDLENSDCSETLSVRRYWALRAANGNLPPHGVIGDRCSGASISLSRITSLEGVNMLSPASTSSKLSNKKDHPLFFRLVAPDNDQGEVGALIALLREFGWERVTVLATDTDFSKDLANEFRKSWVGKHNHSVGHTDTILLIDDDVDNDVKRVDPESVLQTLRDVPTDDPKVNSRIIFLAAHSEHAFEIIQAAHAMKFQPDTVWVGPSSWVGQTDSRIDFASWLPDIPGFIGVAPFRNDDDKVYSEFFSEFQAWQRREGKPVLRELPTFAAETVDGIVAMAKALAETPAPQRRDGAIVAERLRKNQFDGVSGRVEFTTEGDRKNPKYSIYNAKTSRLGAVGDIVWTEAGKVEFGTNGPSAFVDDDVCFANPAGCGLEYVPDDKYPYKDKLPPWVPAVMAILSLFFLALAFKHWRSRLSKRAIRADLEAFQKSIVDMKAAACDYIPHIEHKEQALTGLSVIPPPVVHWCWKETATAMQNHDASTIYGDSANCWILYSDAQSQLLEAAYSAKAAECAPLTGYKVDLKAMVQTKIATGYQRAVCRIVVHPHPVTQQRPTTHDLSNVTIGDALPSDLKDEPQMVLVQGDVIQISKKRDDDWAFGTKLLNADDEKARQLVSVAIAASGKDNDGSVDNDDDDEDDAKIFPDSGWFQMANTRTPSADELKALKQKVASGSLDPPRHWTTTRIANVAERHVLYQGDAERSGLLQSFLSTLGGGNSSHIQIVRVERIQNKAMYQSYIVKRQTICYRETGSDGTGDATVQQNAVRRIERRWLWHGTNAEIVDKIMNQVGKTVLQWTKRSHCVLRANDSVCHHRKQGFNRSFCGKNATAYGKGVYFARDASYSANPLYSVPDEFGQQYILACSVCVGEYCRGKFDAVTPEVRDAANHILYDSTVDNMANPSIYVTYHDSQAYPEYLITFRHQK